MTQEQIILELNKLTKQRALLTKQQNMLRQQLLPYAKYRPGDLVTTIYNSDIWIVYIAKVTTSGKFTYMLKKHKGPPVYSGSFSESVLSPA